MVVWRSLNPINLAVRRLNSSLWLWLSAVVLGGSDDAFGEECSSCTVLDSFSEALYLHPLLKTQSPNLFLARFEFTVAAPASVGYRADQFDLFPKPIGKLLNAHQALVAFEATLTQGRWKEDEWGPAPREFRPPGAVVVAAMNTTSEAAKHESWVFLTSALSGSLCASFGGMNPPRSQSDADQRSEQASGWSQPLDVPWAEPGRQLRAATLPYEPLCTENLTPWLKLLPCGRRRGIATLLAAIAVAEAPLTSLSLAVAAGSAEGRAELRASLELVLPQHPGREGLAAWFGGPGTRGFSPCPAAHSSTVHLWSREAFDPSLLERLGDKVETMEVAGLGGRKRFVMRLPTVYFAVLPSSAQDLAKPTSEGRPQPLVQADGVSVMRDILSQEGKSERTHGRYLLRFTSMSARRHVRFMDHLPFFVQPFWHTLRVIWTAAEQELQELAGLEAMQSLELRFVPSGRGNEPTKIFLSVEVPLGGTISVTLDVLKTFVRLREFSYACEKGFDVGGAVWLEREVPQDDDFGAAPSGPLDLGSVGDFVASLAPLDALSGDAAAARWRWRLRFTEGLLVLVPMPDFSMPFNVIALSSTAVTFFFGSIFRLTAAGRLPHWVCKKEEPPLSRLARTRRWLPLACTLTVAYGTQYLERAQLDQLRASLPAQAAFLADVIVWVKESVAQLLGQGGEDGH